MASWNDRTAIVTGGASGIGRATVVLFARLGCKVMIADIDDEADMVARMVNDAGGSALYVKTDVGSEQDVANMVQQAEQKLGMINVLFANAGIGELGLVHELDMDDWQRLLRINLTGVFLCVKHVVPAMRRAGGGSIVVNGSILGHVGTNSAAAYCASKGGVLSLVRALALDYAADGIRVNAVSPGYIKTPMVMAGPVAELIPQLEALHPVGRLGEPEEVATCVAFLAGDESSFVTGTSLLVDGGYTAR